MDFKTKTTYTVFFKDGTTHESSGFSETITKNTIPKELNWFEFHLTQELRHKDKTLADIKKITYELNYTDTE